MNGFRDMAYFFLKEQEAFPIKSAMSEIIAHLGSGFLGGWAAKGWPCAGAP